MNYTKTMLKKTEETISYIMLYHLTTFGKGRILMRFSTGNMIGSTEITIEMEVTNQGQVQVITKKIWHSCCKFLNKCRKLINLVVEMMIVSSGPSILITLLMKEREVKAKRF